MSRKLFYFFLKKIFRLPILSHAIKWHDRKNKIDKIHDKLILQAKKLALVELQIKIKEQIEKLDDEINLVDSEEEEMPF